MVSETITSTVAALADVDRADHVQLDDRGAQLGVDDRLEGLEDLVARRHASQSRSPTGRHEGAPPVGRRGCFSCRRSRQAPPAAGHPLLRSRPPGDSGCYATSEATRPVTWRAAFEAPRAAPWATLPATARPSSTCCATAVRSMSLPRRVTSRSKRFVRWRSSRSTRVRCFLTSRSTRLRAVVPRRSKRLELALDLRAVAVRREDLDDVVAGGQRDADAGQHGALGDVTDALDDRAGLAAGLGGLAGGSGLRAGGGARRVALGGAGVRLGWPFLAAVERLVAAVLRGGAGAAVERVALREVLRDVRDSDAWCRCCGSWCSCERWCAGGALGGAGGLSHVSSSRKLLSSKFNTEGTTNMRSW